MKQNKGVWGLIWVGCRCRGGRRGETMHEVGGGEEAGKEARDREGERRDKIWARHERISKRTEGFIT